MGYSRYFVEEFPGESKFYLWQAFDVLSPERKFDVRSGRSSASVSDTIEIEVIVHDIRLGEPILRLLKYSRGVGAVVGICRQKMGQDFRAVDASPVKSMEGELVRFVPGYFLGDKIVNTAFC